MNCNFSISLARQVFPGLPGHQVKALGSIATGLISSQKAGILAIGLGMEGPAQPNSCAKRVYRFFSNSRLNVRRACRDLIRKLVRPHRKTLVSIDWTDQGDYQRLELSILTGSRGIPVLWRVFPKAYIRAANGRMRAAEDKIFKTFCAYLPRHAEIEVIFVADRGFQRHSLCMLLNKIDRQRRDLHVRWIIRCKGNLTVRCRDGRELRLNDQKIRRGEIWDLGLVDYALESADEPLGKARILIAYGEEAEEPWYLITNLLLAAPRVAGAYARRFECEETFRTQKNQRFGFGVGAVRLSSEARLERLLLVVAFACLIADIAGIEAERQQLHRKTQLSSRSSRELSLIKLGCEWYRKIRLRITQALALISTLGLQPADVDLFDGVIRLHPHIKVRHKSDRTRRRRPTESRMKVA